MSPELRPGIDTQVRPWGGPVYGQLESVVVHSEALQGNALGDPSDRPLWVYLPPAYDREPERRFPTIYVIPWMT